LSRAAARELAFKIIFQVDIGKNKWQDVLSRSLSEEEDLPEKSRSFLEELVRGTIRHQNEIDREISQYARDWSLERMANTDRNILRMALFELKYLGDIPAGVTVNEAVELAKRYGDVDSGKFVNGILGEIVRNADSGKGPDGITTTTEE
jgi:N utilization substance protein B